MHGKQNDRQGESGTAHARKHHGLRHTGGGEGGGAAKRVDVTVYNRLDRVVLAIGEAEVAITPVDAREIAGELGVAADRAEQTPPDEYLSHRY